MFQRPPARSPPARPVAGWYHVIQRGLGRRPVFPRSDDAGLYVRLLAAEARRGAFELHAYWLLTTHVHLLVHNYTVNYKTSLRSLRRRSSMILNKDLPADKKRLFFKTKLPTRSYTSLWERAYDIQEVFTMPYLRQKLEYIHNNPMQEHWQLVVDPADYPYSSAGFYEGRLCRVKVKNVFETLEQ